MPTKYARIVGRIRRVRRIRRYALMPDAARARLIMPGSLRRIVGRLRYINWHWQITRHYLIHVFLVFIRIMFF